MAGTTTVELVGAVFRDRTSAAAAADTLQRRGLASEDMVTVASRRGRHVIDSGAGSRVLGGVTGGALLGAVVLALVFGTVAFALQPDGLVWTAAAAAGAFVGAVLGAFVGLNRERSALWAEENWMHVGLQPDEILLVARTRDDSENTLAILEGHGGRCVRPSSGA